MMCKTPADARGAAAFSVRVSARKIGSHGCLPVFAAVPQKWVPPRLLRVCRKNPLTFFLYLLENPFSRAKISHSVYQ